MEQPDLELAKLAASGDRGAFHMIVQRHSSGLFRIARSLCRCNSDAEDVVQDAFLAAYRGIGKFDGRSSLKTWLARIVMKRSISQWRKNRRHRSAVSLEPIHEPAGGESRSMRMSGTAAVDQRLDLAEVLPRVAEEYREVFILREIQGLSYAQIADALEIPAGNCANDSRATEINRDRDGVYDVLRIPMEAEQPLQHASATPLGACECQSRLGAFHDGELDGEAEQIIERHLASCEICRAELEEIRELSQLAGQIGLDGMSPLALQRLHRTIDGQQQSASIFRVAGVLTGLAASAMVVGAAWLWDVPKSGYRSSSKIVVFNPRPADKWEYLAVNLKSDPLPKSQWELNDRQTVVENNLTNWMVEGLSGSGR